MSNINFLGSPLVQFFNPGTGAFLSGGLLYSYAPASTTPTATYATIADATNNTNPNTNPVVLDSTGSAAVVLKGGTKLVLTDSLGNQVWAVDNLNTQTANIYDTSGNLLLEFNPAASAVNYLEIANSATGSPVVISTNGSDTNVGLNINALGSGTVTINSPLAVTNNITTTGSITSTGNVVTGNSTLATTGITSPSATISGNSTIGGTLGITGTLGVTGATTLTTLACTGLANFTAAGVTGYTAGSAAPTGAVGEVLITTWNTTASLSTGVAFNMHSIALTAGDWQVTATGTFIAAGSTIPNVTTIGLNTTSGTLPVPSTATMLGSSLVSIQAIMDTGASSTMHTRALQVNVSGPTTLYLVGQALFTISTMSAGGIIMARRTR